MARVRQMTAFWTTLALCTGALALSGCGESIPVVGEEFKDCDDCPTMVVVPAGSFQMGEPLNELNEIIRSRTNNFPPGYWGEDKADLLHNVTIPKNFAVGKFEITFDEWDACVSGGGCNGYRPDDEGWGRGTRPVTYVSWNDVKSYIAWLSNESGEPYRLLSEAEWEYAARAGTTTPFSFGETITTDQANYDGNETYADGPKGEYREQTMPVGSFPANSFGLHDMHGNVLEWTEDCWNQSYAGAPSDGSAWTSGRCDQRVLRAAPGKAHRYRRDRHLAACPS